MPATPFSSSSFQGAIAQRPLAPAPSTGQTHTILQLIDAREVIRLLAFHLVHSGLKDNSAQKRFVKAALAHLHHGGVYTGAGLKEASGAIEPVQIGGKVKVLSLWLAGLRDARGYYWRSYQINGYKPDPFPSFPESLLVQGCLQEFARRQGQELIAEPGLEFMDLAQEILSRSLYGAASRVLVLSSSKQALQLVRDRPVLVAKVALKENAGQRAMGVRDAYGWLAGRLEHASASKQALFFDMAMPEFLAHPCKFLGRWDYLERVGIRQFKAQAKYGGGIPIELLSVCEGQNSEHYPCKSVVENCLSKISNYLHKDSQVSAEQLSTLEKFIISSGQGLPFAKVKLPLRLSVFDA